MSRHRKLPVMMNHRQISMRLSMLRNRIPKHRRFRGLPGIMRWSFPTLTSFPWTITKAAISFLQSRVMVNSCWYRMEKRRRRICRTTSQCFRIRRRAFIWWQPLRWTFSADWMRWIISVCPEQMQTVGISIRRRRRLKTEILRLQESTAHRIMSRFWLQAAILRLNLR